jgi:Protein of unknown function (DUF2934)
MPRTTKKASSKIVTMPKAVPAQLTHEPEPAESEVARRAYEIYCSRGRQHGHDLDDWLQARRELKSQRTTAA